jgi:hypothetical protein
MVLFSFSSSLEQSSESAGNEKSPLDKEAFCDSAGIRTQDPYIKSVLLYQLSYRIFLGNVRIKPPFIALAAANILVIFVLTSANVVFFAFLLFISS